MNTNGNESENLSEMLDPYAREWRDMMVDIWRDKLDFFGIHDTGALSANVMEGSYLNDNGQLLIDFQFLEYGIFVDSGVGKGYTKGNNGDLEFLNPYYRYTHKLKKPREKRPWFSHSWYISREVIKEKAAQMAGEAFVGFFDNLD